MLLILNNFDILANCVTKIVKFSWRIILVKIDILMDNNKSTALSSSV